MDVEPMTAKAVSEVNRRMDEKESGGVVEPSDVIDTVQFPITTPFPNSTQTNIAMPELADLSDISLHSPSSQIVGTPFATDSTKFEYPFPDTSPSSGFRSPQQSSAVISPSASTLSMSNIAGNPDYPPLESCSSFPMLSTAILDTHTPSNAPSIPEVSLAPNGLGLTYSSLAPSEMPSYNPAHPKLKTASPPVPPSLVKKRTRWTLGLGSLGRRRSFSSTTSGSPGREHAPRFSVEDPDHSSPLGSPQEEQNNKH